MAATEEGRFLSGSTMGHVVRMTLTGAMGITFVFVVDAANLFWLSQLDEPILMAAIGYAFAVQFFAVSIGVGLMIAATAVVSRSIGRGERALAREQGAAAMLLTVLTQGLTASLVILFREPFLESVGARGEALTLAARYLALTMPSLTVMAVGLTGSDLPPAGPSFITRVCRLDLGIRVPRLAQARRARSPQIAQASGALAAVSGWPGTSVA